VWYFTGACVRGIVELRCQFQCLENEAKGVIAHECRRNELH